MNELIFHDMNSAMKFPENSLKRAGEFNGYVYNDLEDDNSKLCKNRVDNSPLW